MNSEANISLTTNQEAQACMVPVAPLAYREKIVHYGFKASDRQSISQVRRALQWDIRLESGMLLTSQIVKRRS